MLFKVIFQNKKVLFFNQKEIVSYSDASIACKCYRLRKNLEILSLYKLFVDVMSQNLMLLIV